MNKLNIRNATLADTLSLLTHRQEVKHDLVVPASALRAKDGLLRVRGADHQITSEGVTSVDGIYRPTEVADEGIAGKLGIPVGYLKRMRENATDLYDANVNGWLHGKSVRRANPNVAAGESAIDVLRQGDQRSFMLRTFRNPEGGEGIARAFVSDRYDIVDDLDALTAVLGAVKESGTDVEILRCDLTDRNMYVRVAAPQISALAPALLAGYRSPFPAPEGTDPELPVVFAGFEIRNSEVGDGAFTIVPIIIVRVCGNGMTFTKEAFRKVHLGAKLEHGAIQVSNETRRKNLDLVMSQTKDAVRAFLSPEWIQERINEVEELAGVEVKSPEGQVRTVCKQLKFTEEETNGIFSHFIKGGQLTAGGVLNAVTSYSQLLGNADRARFLDDRAVDALAHIAG